MDRRKGYAEVKSAQEAKVRRHRKAVRRWETAGVLMAFGGVAFVIYYMIWFMCTSYIGG